MSSSLYALEDHSIASLVVLGALNLFTSRGSRSRPDARSTRQSDRRHPSNKFQASASNSRSHKEVPSTEEQKPRPAQVGRSTDEIDSGVKWVRNEAKATIKIIPVHEQSQSPLLVLPTEILRLIYEKVLGNNLLHIVRRTHGLGHTICKCPKNSIGNPQLCREAECRGSKAPTGVYVNSGPDNQEQDPIPLLQTCRKV